jgi:hypothetical protein
MVAAVRHPSLTLPVEGRGPEVLKEINPPREGEGTAKKMNPAREGGDRKC